MGAEDGQNNDLESSFQLLFFFFLCHFYLEIRTAGECAAGITQNGSRSHFAEMKNVIEN